MTYYCQGCGRDELTCSKDPCDDVLEDREAVMPDDERTTRYFHTECCCNISLKTEGPNQKQVDEFETKCPLCGKDVVAKQVERWEYERLTAAKDDCANCGQPIVFLPDLLAWLHHEVDEEISVLEPDYGVRSCEDAMKALLGLPAPEYAGKEAEPADTHVTVDLRTGVETPASVEAFQKVTGNKTRYNPRITSQPGQQLEVEVDIPDDATEHQHLEAMEEAIEAIMPGFTRSLGGR